MLTTHKSHYMLKMSFYNTNTCTDRSLLIDDFSSQSHVTQTGIDQTLLELIDVIQCRVQDAFSS